MQNFCILQVEDEENDIILLRHAMQRIGMVNPVPAVRDGQQAVDYLAGVGAYADRKRHPLPCLVLLDLKLPRKMGLEVLQWIRQQPGLKTLLVIIFTSSAQKDDVDKAYRAGANAFLVKPSGADELIEMLQVFKLFWLRYNQAPGECQEVAAVEPRPATVA